MFYSTTIPVTDDTWYHGLHGWSAWSQPKQQMVSGTRVRTSQLKGLNADVAALRVQRAANSLKFNDIGHGVTTLDVWLALDAQWCHAHRYE